jgi:UDP:flavonoid glycosyltransferase YjiC (YdhE family)
MIEPILHQIWHPFVWPELPRDWERFSRSWRRLHPEHRHVLWGVEESRAFVAEHHREFLPVYDAYPSPMLRVAALRYLLLAHFGGIYADLDMECLRSVDPLLAGERLVLAVEPEPRGAAWRPEPMPRVLTTAFMASEARHPFWTAVIAELKRSADLPGVQEAAGTGVLTRCFEAETDRTAIALKAADLVCPVAAADCEDGTAYDLEAWMQATEHAFAVHHCAGSWSRSKAREHARRPYPLGLPARLRHPGWTGARRGQLFDRGPTVSCLMVTRGWARPARWAIDAFREQSYPNRELVIVTTNRDGDLAPWVESLHDPRIRFLEPLPTGTPLGVQRNAAVDGAKGEFVCTWDDDDLYGVDRLAACMTAIGTTGADAAFLERICVWWPARQHLALTGRRPWENTMIARRAVLPRYPELDRGEDSRVVEELAATRPIVTVDDPNLYTYVAWGTNTWGPDHFQTLLRRASFQAEKVAYDRALSALDKHVPVLEYLAWLEERDPRSFVPPPDSPAQLTARPAAPRPAEGDGSRVQAARAVPAPQGGRPLRFLLAWEIGAGFGHMVPLAQVAGPLLDAGHEVHLALRDLSTARAGLGELAAHARLRLWQSPHWAAPFYGSGDPACYAEMLFRAGYLDPKRLIGLVDGWTTLFRQVKPDLLLAEHAPTALLAARGERFPCALLGSGFFVPVRENPIPTFREWEAIPAEHVKQAEARVLATCNAILGARGRPALGMLAELFDVAERFLITVPELDYYAQRARDPEQRYCGPLAPPRHGRPASWPAGTEPAVFAYIRGEYAGVEDALRALRAGPWRVLAFVPGLAPARAVDLSSSRMIVVAEPVDMAEVCTECDAVICNSGSGTVATVLQAGKPLVMLPLHVEQFIIARRVRSLGAGLILLPERLEEIPAALGRVLGETAFREAARAFARRHAAQRGNTTAETIAARCAELASGAGPTGAGAAGGRRAKPSRRR